MTDRERPRGDSEDRQRVLEVFYRYATCHDLDDEGGMSACVMRDAEYVLYSSDGMITLRRPYASSVHPPRRRLYLTNPIFDEIGPDRAVASMNFLAIAVDDRSVFRTGLYRHTFAKQDDGRWMISTFGVVVDNER